MRSQFPPLTLQPPPHPHKAHPGEWDKLPAQGGLLGDGFAVTVNEITGGTVTLASKDVSDSNFDITVGQQVSLTATPSTGKFVLWTVEGIELTQAERIASSLVFTMPGNPVTISSAFVSYVPNPVGEVNVNGVIWAKTNVLSAGVFADSETTYGQQVRDNAAAVSCPTGWNAPSQANWTALANNADGGWSGNPTYNAAGGLRFYTFKGEVIPFVMSYAGGGWCAYAFNVSSPRAYYHTTIGTTSLATIAVSSSETSLVKMTRCVRTP